MNEQNKITIDAYNEEVQAYILQTPSDYQEYHRPMLNWIEAALLDLPLNSRVLEIGSATPRDATFMRSKGYHVQTSDGTAAFVDNLRAKGEDAIKLNVLTDPIPGNYSLIFANAVAPHFTLENMQTFIKKTEESLDTGGRLAFNIKQGLGDQWIDEKFDHKRFIKYWQPEDIRNLLLDHKFKIIFFDSSAPGDLPTHHWCNIVVEKV